MMWYNEGRILEKSEKLNSEGKLAWVKCYVGNFGSERAHQSRVLSSQSITGKSQKQNVEQKKDTKLFIQSLKTGQTFLWGQKPGHVNLCGGYRLLLEKGQKRASWGVGGSVLMEILSTIGWYVCECLLSCTLKTGVVF